MRFRFGVFELDLEEGELHKNGLKVKLQGQPYQLLALLVERSGQIVSREEICQQLWPDGTFVEFDRSLNVAVNKIRDALGDTASSPRFLETVPRRTCWHQLCRSVGRWHILPAQREFPFYRFHRCS